MEVVYETFDICDLRHQRQFKPAGLPLHEWCAETDGVRWLSQLQDEEFGHHTMQSMQRSGLLLLRLYKKKAWDMATPDFQRLVRMDPENDARVANYDVLLFVVLSHPWHHGLLPINFSPRNKFE